MDDAIYCCYCSDTDADTDNDTKGFTFAKNNENVLKVLPKLVRLKPRREELRRSRSSSNSAKILKLLTKLLRLEPQRKELKRSRPSTFYRSTEGINVRDTKNKNERTTKVWKQKLLQVSNIASLLCVIDCTILPIVTIMLPLVGMGASSEQEEWLHHMGHKVAMNFVLPVGGLTAIMNFTSHMNISLALVSFSALFLIFAANASCHSPVLSILPHNIVHLMHGGITHRCLNISGCFLLLAVNYYGSTLACNDFCCFRRRGKM